MVTVRRFMILFATLLPFAAASVISRSVDRLPTQEDTSTIGLNDAAHYANKLYFGTATNYGEFNDTMYFHLLDDIHMFGQLTPAKAMKWVSLSTYLARVLNGRR